MGEIRERRPRRARAAIAAGLAGGAAWLSLLAACSGSGGSPAVEPDASASKGQVQAAAAYKLSHYAASRFAEQASFGPTPALVQELRSKGFERWIDDQFAMAPSLVDMVPLQQWHLEGQARHALYQHWVSEYTRLFLAAPDQLRLRVSWALSQVIVVSTTKIDVVAVASWMNLLQQRSLGGYADLLYHASIHPGMGYYLDNQQNRPQSDDCPWCAPNENFARELMQLFSLGVVKLQPDGTPLRNARGGFVETYTQKDVEELARALTGWNWNPDPPERPGTNWGNWLKPMVPSTWPPERDSGQKVVMGTVFPAGKAADAELRDVIAMLMKHPNIAPFVATRMIQHLVKSNPTPAYVKRVAERFRDNGRGVAGDLKAVVKAVLLDDEARAGDDPARAQRDDGKLREPVLHRMAAQRGLGCTRAFVDDSGEPDRVWTQEPFRAESVFSFYAPTDRAPGSNVLAPEQKLATPPELTARVGQLQWRRWNNGLQRNSMAVYTAAGCRTDELVRAYASSPRAFADHLSERWFRGAMPPTLRISMEQMIRQPSWDNRSPEDGAMVMLGFALATPTFGVIK
jgi:uncharacterized protein (DUF1800 family)